MDIILPEHTAELLEQTFDAHFLYDHPLYSVMAEPTELPWILVIPKQPLTDRTYIEKLYGEIYQLVEILQQAGFGPHFNLAKIGNKNPNQHIHVIFRQEDDEVWPDAVWCHEPVKASSEMPEKLRQALASYFSK